jgi:hypothetical protein
MTNKERLWVFRDPVTGELEPHLARDNVERKARLESYEESPAFGERLPVEVEIVQRSLQRLWENLEARNFKVLGPWTQTKSKGHTRWFRYTPFVKSWASILSQHGLYQVSVWELKGWDGNAVAEPDGFRNLKDAKKWFDDTLRAQGFYLINPRKVSKTGVGRAAHLTHRRVE